MQPPELKPRVEGHKGKGGGDSSEGREGGTWRHLREANSRPRAFSALLAPTFTWYLGGALRSNVTRLSRNGAADAALAFKRSGHLKSPTHPAGTLGVLSPRCVAPGRRSVKGRRSPKPKPEPRLQLEVLDLDLTGSQLRFLKSRAKLS